MVVDINQSEIREVLRKACQDAGSQQEWARANNLSPAYVSDVLNGKKDVGDTIAEALGYMKFIRFSTGKTD